MGRSCARQPGHPLRIGSRVRAGFNASSFTLAIDVSTLVNEPGAPRGLAASREDWLLCSLHSELPRAGTPHAPISGSGLEQIPDVAAIAAG